MPTINTNLVPTIAPGTIFERFASDSSLNIRWVTAMDPVFYEVYNRPMADLAVRSLVLAKALDNLSVQLGKQTLYPFLTQPRVADGSNLVELPSGWLWDVHVSMPVKWQKVRLAKIKRLSGSNGDSTAGEFTGKLRLIFTAETESSTSERSLFYVDYTIGSPLSYQTVRVTIVTDAEESNAIESSEANTISGFVTLRTLDETDSIVQSMYDLLAPVDLTDTNADGIFDTPAEYEVVDSDAGGTDVTGDSSLSTISHGTGLLVDSAWNSVPALSATTQEWVESFNYPFTTDASRLSADGIQVPAGLFKEFNVVAPAGDQEDGDTSGLQYPVYLSRVEEVESGTARFYLATWNVTDSDAEQVAVEFASFDVVSTASTDDRIAITPVTDLQLKGSTNFQQGFGLGHVTLSDLWSEEPETISEFYEDLSLIADDPKDTAFTLAAARLSSFAISRVPKYAPTKGQSQALVGTTNDADTPVHPSETNRFVVEADQGLGSQIDLNSLTGITAHGAFERYGYTGSLCHRIVYLPLDYSQITSSASFYTDHVLPRLTALLGRAPKFGDGWFNGTKFTWYNGNTFQD